MIENRNCGPVTLAGVEMPYLTVQEIELDVRPSKPPVTFAADYPRFPPPEPVMTCLAIGDGETRVWRNEWKFDRDALIPDDVPADFPVDLLNRLWL